MESQTWCSGSAGWNVPSCRIWVVTMLLLDLVCSCSLLTEAILDSSVPLTKIIDLLECKYSVVQYLVALGMRLNMKEYHKELQLASYSSYLYWLPMSGPWPNTCLGSWLDQNISSSSPKLINRGSYSTWIVLANHNGKINKNIQVHLTKSVNRQSYIRL